MKKEYYYNLKLTEKEFICLGKILQNIDFKDLTIEGQKVVNDILTKHIDTFIKVLNIKIEDFKKEDDKCQNHK